MNKEDLKQIKEVVEIVVDARIEKSETRMKGAITQEIEKSEKRMIAEIESLAQMTAKGFEEVGKRVDSLEENQKQIIQHLDGIDTRISAYASNSNDNFDGLREWVKGIDNRLTVVEKKVYAKAKGK